MNIADSRRHPATDGEGASLDSVEVRALAIVSGLGRLAIGLGLAGVPRRMLAMLGFKEVSPSMVVVARIAGGRDLVLGAVTLAALGDADRLQAASVAGAAVDAGDAATFLAALAHGQELRTVALRGLAAALPATLAGIWVARRLAVSSGRA